MEEIESQNVIQSDQFHFQDEIINPQEQPITLGDKIEDFYLHLMDPKKDEDNLFRLSDSLYSLEHHFVQLEQGENIELVREIVKDCHRKASSHVRSLYIEAINGLITSSRKKLKIKISLEHSQDLQQKHLTIILELLGQWSNILANLIQYQFSKSFIQLSLASLYHRVLECVYDTYSTFVEDKDLTNWCVKCQYHSSGNFNLHSLDTLLIQLSSIRQILNQNYLYLFNTFNSIETLDQEELSQSILYSASDSWPMLFKKAWDTNQRINYFELNVQSMLFPTIHEVTRWREIDTFYVTLESAYLTHSVITACEDFSLIVFEGNDTFTLQCLEDIIYIQHKVIERSIGFNEELAVFGVGQKILEVIAFPQQLELCEKDFKISLVQELLTSKKIFYNCVRKSRIQQRYIQELLKKYITAYHPPIETIEKEKVTNNSGNLTTPVKKNISPPPSQSSLISPTQAVSASSPTIEPSKVNFSEQPSSTNSSTNSMINLFSDVVAKTTGSSSSEVVSNVTGNVNSWLTSWTNKVTAAATSSNMEEFLLNALDMVPDMEHPLDKTPLTTISDISSEISGNLSKSSVFGSPAPSSGSGGIISSGLMAAISTPSAASLTHHEDIEDEYDYEYDCEALYSSLPQLPGNQSTLFQKKSKKLKIRDWIVQLNAIVNVIQMILTFQQYLQDCELNLLSVQWQNQVPPCLYPLTLSSSSLELNTSSSFPPQNPNQNQMKSSLSILIQEFHISEINYTRYLEDDLEALIHYQIYSEAIYTQLQNFLIRSFDISGQEMEEKYHEYYLVKQLMFPWLHKHFPICTLAQDLPTLITRNFAIPSRSSSSSAALSLMSNAFTSLWNTWGNQNTSSTTTSIPSSSSSSIFGNQEPPKSLSSCLSDRASVYYLHSLSKYIANLLLDRFYYNKQRKLNEWGAILLQNEIVHLQKFFELLLPLDQISILHKNLEKLMLIAKLLTLDSPTDIKLYNLTTEMFPRLEEEVRNILLQRVDYPSDIISKMKINLI